MKGEWELGTGKSAEVLNSAVGFGAKVIVCTHAVGVLRQIQIHEIGKGILTVKSAWERS